MDISAPVWNNGVTHKPGPEGDPMGRYLVVANLTVLGDELADALRWREERDDGARFHLVLPAQRHDADRALAASEHLRYPGEPPALSGERLRLRQALETMREWGLDVTGEVSRLDPVRAVEAALRDDTYDEIVVSTLPQAVSRWLRIDVPARLRRHTELPVVHVEARPRVTA